MSSLPASAFRPGDRVIGEDDGERLFGVVVDYTPVDEHDPDLGTWVLVRWSDEEYDENSLGTLVPSELLRLWPERAHAARLREVNS